MTQKEEYENVCENIRYLRRVSGLSRTAMARRLHITVKTLDVLEAGTFPERINIRFFFQVSQTFGVPPRRLLSVRLEEMATDIP